MNFDSWFVNQTQFSALLNIHTYSDKNQAASEKKNSGQTDHKNNNENNVGNDGIAAESADALSHKENTNSEQGGNSNSNNNDPFDFEEFLKFENIGDFLAVRITICNNLQSIESD